MLMQVNLNQPMAKVLETLRAHPVRTRLSLTGTLVVARDIAHAKLKERLDAGHGLPQYLKVRAAQLPLAAQRRAAPRSWFVARAGQGSQLVDWQLHCAAPTPHLQPRLCAPPPRLTICSVCTC